MATNEAWSDRADLWFQLGMDATVGRGAKSSPVEAAVSLIAGDISTLGLHLVEEREDGTKVKIKNSPIARVLQKPNPYSTRVDLINRLIRDTIFHGNAYVWIERDNRGQPMWMYNIEPRREVPKVLSDGSVWYSIGLTDLEAGEQSGQIDVPASDVIHHRVLTMRHPLIGVSPLYAIGDSASLNAYLSAALAKFHQNSSRPGGILSIPQGLRPEARERLREEFGRAFSGENSGKTAVVDTEVNFVKMGSTASENQAVDLLKFSIEDVARALRIPRFMLGLETVGQASVEQSSRQYFNGCLRPWVEGIEARFDDVFGLLGTEREIEFDLDDLFRAETATRIDALAKGLASGIYTVNEARRKEHLPPIPGGEAGFMQRQMTPINLLSELAAADLKAANEPPPAPVAPPAPPQKSAEEITKAILTRVQVKSGSSAEDIKTRILRHGH